MKPSAVFLAVGLCLSGALPVGAEAPQPFPDFTFKRVGVPQPGGGKRITVQIEPGFDPWGRAATPDPSDPPDTPQDATRPAMPYDWYWAAISPRLADAGPGRLDAAVAALAPPDGEGPVPTPPLQRMAELAGLHGTDILVATVGTRVSPALVLAVMAVESSGRTDAVSPKGAMGLMQLMPDTATRFGVSDRSDPVQNIRGGVAYLNWLMTEFGGDPVMVLAGYNAGEGAVRSNDGVPPYAETRAYVPKVLAAWDVARRLCMTLPDLISDGCVFSLAAARG